MTQFDPDSPRYRIHLRVILTFLWVSELAMVPYAFVFTVGGPELNQMSSTHQQQKAAMPPHQKTFLFLIGVLYSAIIATALYAMYSSKWRFLIPMIVLTITQLGIVVLLTLNLIHSCIVMTGVGFYHLFLILLLIYILAHLGIRCFLIFRLFEFMRLQERQNMESEEGRFIDPYGTARSYQSQLP